MNGTVEKVSDDGRLIAVYRRNDLGNKGVIYAKNEQPDIAYFNAGIPTITYEKERYHVVKYCMDYPAMMREFYRLTTAKYSAYAQ